MAITWTEQFSAMTLAGTGWQNYDLYTNCSVPKGAVAAILMLYNTTGTTHNMGVRTDGSSLERRFLVCPRYSTTGTGNTPLVMYVKCDSSTGYIETYATATGSTFFYCIGYWQGTDFTEQFTSCMPGSASAWTDVNLNTVASVPVGRVVSVCLANKEYNTGNTLGIRTNGSSVVRYFPVKGGTTSGGAQCHVVTMQAKTDSSGIVEIYSTDLSNTLVYCTGYFDAEMSYVENIQTITMGSTGWQDSDLSAYLDVDGRVTDIYTASSRASTTCYNLGARINGSAIDGRRFFNDGAGTSLYVPTCWPTKTDASGILETYTSNASYEYIRYLGYYKDLISTNSLTPTSNAVFTKPIGTISSSVTSDTTPADSSHRHTFWTLGRHWAFWVSGTNGNYSSSTDGITWASSNTFTSGGGTTLYPANFALWFDKTYVHVAWAINTTNFYYRRGLLNSDGSITWDSTQTIAAGGTVDLCKSICVSTDGNAFVTFNVGTTTKTPYVWKNSNKDGTWSTTSGFPYQLTSTASSAWSTVLLPLTSGNVMALYGNGGTIKQKIWTESSDSWDTESAATTSNAYIISPDYGGFSAIYSPDTGEVHLAFTTATNYIFYRRRNSSGTWQSEENIVSVGAGYPSSLAFDEKNNDLYLFLFGPLSAGTINYKKRSNAGTWDASWTDFVTGQSNLNYGAANTVCYDSNGLKLGVTFFTGSASPWTLNYQFISFGSELYITKTSDASFYSDVCKEITSNSDARFKNTIGVTTNSNASLYGVSSLTKNSSALFWTGFAGGAGTSTNPYQISTALQLQCVRLYPSAYFILINDIDASDTINWGSGAGFIPINTFTGNFDGRGFSIHGLYIYRPTESNIGLFSIVNNGVVKRVGLVDASIGGLDYVGSLAGLIYGNSSSIIYCKVSGDTTITGYGTGSDYVGGFIGCITGNVSNCYVHITNVIGTNRVGGFVGYIYSDTYTATMVNCYSVTDVTGSGTNIGGMVGDKDETYGTVTITSCYFDSDIAGMTTSDGGTPKTTTQMKTKSTYSGWSIDDAP